MQQTVTSTSLLLVRLVRIDGQLFFKQTLDYIPIDHVNNLRHEPLVDALVHLVQVTPFFRDSESV